MITPKKEKIRKPKIEAEYGNENEYNEEYTTNNRIQTLDMRHIRTAITNEKFIKIL